MLPALREAGTILTGQKPGISLRRMLFATFHNVRDDDASVSCRSMLQACKPWRGRSRVNFARSLIGAGFSQIPLQSTAWPIRGAPLESHASCSRNGNPAKGRLLFASAREPLGPSARGTGAAGAPVVGPARAVRRRRRCFGSPFKLLVRERPRR